MSLNKGMLFNTIGVVELDDYLYKYSSCNYSNATLAYKIDRMTGRPKSKQFMIIFNEELLSNCQIGKYEILAAKNISGPDIAALKGKTTSKKQNSVNLKKSNIYPDLLLR